MMYLGSKPATVYVPGGASRRTKHIDRTWLSGRWIARVIPAAVVVPTLTEAIEESVEIHILLSVQNVERVITGCHRR